MPEWRENYAGVEEMQLAVMGCIVNGPGRSKHADIGISLPGTGEAPTAPVFIDGEKRMTLRGEGLKPSNSSRSSKITSVKNTKNAISFAALKTLPWQRLWLIFFWYQAAKFCMLNMEHRGRADKRGIGG